MKSATILGVCMLWAASARAEEPRFGAVAPAVLPAQSTAVNVFFGAPEVGVGFRQGIGPAEVDAEASLDYFDLTVAGEVRGRVLAFHRDGFELAPYLGMGLAWDSGSTYEDPDNFRYTAVRVHLGALATQELSPSVALVGEAQLKWDLFTSPSGGHRLEPLFGGGVEVLLADGVSALAMGELGLDARALPNGFENTSLGYSVRFGFGFRLF